jgi:hypothetical protein
MSGHVPYRSILWKPRRLLVLRSNPLRTAMSTCCAGFVLALTGIVVSPITGLLRSPSGSEVATSAVATVFVLVGATLVVRGILMQRSRITLTLEQETLTIHGCGDQHARPRVLPVHDIEEVGLEVDEAPGGSAYRVRICVRGSEPVRLGEAWTALRDHSERVATEVRSFLDA